MDCEIKISVVIPVYNLQEELPRCVASIVAQTYDNLEIILVDDGSEDKSRSVIKQLAESDKRIVPIYKENGGVTSARLEGARQATGEYIGFVDGDDEIDPDMYELLMRNAVEYNADISHCGYQMMFNDGRVNYFYNTGNLTLQDKKKGIEDLLEGTVIEPSLCNKLFSKKLFWDLLHSGLMDESIKLNEDLLMNYYLFSAAEKSVFQDVCKYHYIARGSSALRQKLSGHRIYDPIRVKQIILKNCEQDIKPLAERAALNTCIYSYCSLMLEKCNTLKAEKKDVRALIFKYYAHLKELPQTTRILAWGITRMPKVFGIMYPIYSKFFQKKIYE